MIFNAVEQQYLQRKGQLTYCIDPGWLPFEGLSPSGDHIGMSADYQQFFQSLLPIPLRLVKTADWTDSLIAARSHACDLLLLAMETPERQQYLTFTEPYLSIPSAVVTRQQHSRISSIQQLSEPSENQPRTFGIRHSFGFAELYRQRYPKLALVDVKSYEEGFLMVQSGQIEGMLGNIGSLSYLLQQYRMTNLKIAGRIEGDSDLSIATRNDEPELAAIASLLIAQITPQLRQQIDNKWLVVRMEAEPDYQLVGKVVVIAVLLLAFVGWAYHKVHRLNLQLRAVNSRLEAQNQHDPLTGLFNRQYLNNRLPELLAHCQRHSWPLTLAMLDLDHFKQLNDQYGHLVGDACLRKFAGLISQHFKRPADVLVRFGGEEFVLLSVNNQDLDIQQKLQHFLAALSEQQIEHSGEQVCCTVSIGWVHAVPQRHATADEWLQAADQAMYQAKAAGRNCVKRATAPIESKF